MAGAPDVIMVRLLAILAIPTSAVVGRDPACLSELRASGISIALPSMTELYQNNTRGANPDWDGRGVMLPSFAVLPTSTSEVARCMQCAASAGVRVSVRGGGHSFGGYGAMLPPADGFIISLSQMRTVSNVVTAGNKGLGKVVVAGGARWEDVYRSFQRSGQNWVATGGSCPSVGVASFVQGGGVGPAVRLHGMAIDSVLAFELVTGNGSRIVNASAAENADLFWALRGGGGGNFGVVTSLTMRVYPGPHGDSYAWGSVCWPYTDKGAERIILAAGSIAPTLPPWINVDVVTSRKGGLCLWVVSIGGLAETREALQPVLAAIGDTSAANDTLQSHNCWWEMISSFALERGYTEFDAKPFFSKNVLVDEVSAELAGDLALQGRAAPENCDGTHLIAFSGPHSPNRDVEVAFPWRDSSYMVYASCSYDEGKNDSKAAASAFLDGWMAATTSHSNGGSYVNFIDPRGRQAADARYYGSNVEKLRRVKGRWNPWGIGPLHFPLELLER